MDTQRLRAQRVAIDHRAPPCTGSALLGKAACASIATLLCLSALLARTTHAQDGAAGEQMYRYVNTKGRVVYTNAAEQVPLAKRESARIDLSRVSLNTEVGAEIERRLEEQHMALTQSTYCKRMLAAANANFLERAWDDDAASILCGIAVLALLLFSPGMLRRVSAPVWAKTLMTAIPALASIGLIAFMVTHANKTLDAIKARAEPCMHETFTRMDGEKDALMRRSKLVEHLQQEASKLERMGDSKIRDLLNH